MKFPDPMLPPIVIVDDSEDDVFLLRHRLRAGGVTNPIRAFSNVDAALDYLRHPPADERKPHLVFTDIKMEAGSGYALIQKIRSEPEWDSTMIVVVTSSSDPNELQRAVEAGANGYLLKFPPADLLAEFVHSGPWFSVSTASAAPAPDVAGVS